MKEGLLLHSRIKTIVSVIIVIFVFSILFVPGQYFKAEELESSPAIHLTGSWVNPSYVDMQSQPQPANTMQPMAEATTYTATNESELRSVIFQAFTNRETYPQITYTGDVSILGAVDEFGALINVDGLSSIIQSTINTDDYLKFNMVSYPYIVQQNGSSFLISFINDKDPLSPTYVSYLTTLAQENDVDTAVTGILSAIIEPGMNDHQIVKAIHDYIVANVAYDTTYVQHSAYAALYGDKKTVCQGYALLAYKMLIEEGFEARIISGMAGLTNPESHAWNRVLLDGKWYNVDCTWDDPTPDEPGRVIYPYYHLNDVELSADHFTDAEYTGLPVAPESYTTTLEYLIAANPANEIYPRLQQQLGFNYLLAANTAEDATALEAKWLTAAQNVISNFIVRYNNSSNDLSSTMLSDMFYRVADVTDLKGYGLSYADFNRGAGTDYVLLNFNLPYFIANAAPSASSPVINGSANVGQTLTGTYVYADADIPADTEGLSQYQWYRGVNSDGSDKTPIPGAIGTSYTVSTRDADKYLFFEVTPIASTGTLQGNSVLSAASAAVGPALEGTDECFIATAAFGSKFTWPVALLRHFRDQYLLTNPAGRAFVDFYYHNSPPIAAFIAGSEPLKALVRVLLAPIIAMVYMIYHPTLMVTALGLLIALLAYWRRRLYWDCNDH